MNDSPSGITSRQLERVSKATLKWMYGESQGKDKEVESELRRRGLSSKQLAEVEWNHSQRKWTTAARQAARTRTKRTQAINRKRRRQQRRRRAEARRQKRIAFLASLKQGVVITGKDFDPSACDGSCPF
jgi:hypothetical protein